MCQLMLERKCAWPRTGPCFFSIKWSAFLRRGRSVQEDLSAQINGLKMKKSTDATSESWIVLDLLKMICYFPIGESTRHGESNLIRWFSIFDGPQYSAIIQGVLHTGEPILVSPLLLHIRGGRTWGGSRCFQHLTWTRSVVSDADLPTFRT